MEHCGQARLFLPELHVYQANVDRILARVAVAKQDFDEAKRRYEMAADGFKYAGQMWEWDDTMYEVSRIALEDEDYRHVIQVLEEIQGVYASGIGGERDLVAKLSICVDLSLLIGSLLC